MSTPPSQRNGGAHLGVSQGGSKGPSPHMTRRGTKKPAPAPPKHASPFATQAPGSPHQPHFTPRRNASRESLIHAPSHPPPQPPQAQQGHAESEGSPPSSPTPPDTPPHDVLHPNYHSGSLPRPARPAPRPRPRPSIPPPPQPATSDNGNGTCSSASKIITDSGFVGRAASYEVTECEQEESSAGQEPAVTPAPTSNSDMEIEITSL